MCALLRADRTDEADVLAVTMAERLTLRFHDLRHTAVSLLLALGVPPHVVREIAGHSDIKVTMMVYAHGNIAGKAAALTQLGGVLLSPADVTAPVTVDEDQ